jgi:hypothetical protein
MRRVVVAVVVLGVLGPGMPGARVAIADPGEPASDVNAPTLRPALTRHGWQLDLTGYLQVDAVAWSQDSVDELDPATADPLNEERFLIRRGRLRAEARRDGFVGAIEFDGNTVDGGTTARLLGAQAGWTFARPELRGAPVVAVTAGLFKIPFGVEVPASERDKAFLEAPAFARALFPGNYDAGVMAQGSYGSARWSIAMLNGSPVGDAQWRGKDPTSSYDLVGRIGAVVHGPRKLRVEAGVSVLTGTGLHPGTPATKDDLQWVDENGDGIVQVTELQVIPGASATPSQPFSRDALGADVQVHWCLCKLGKGTAYAEAALATNLDRGLVYADPIAQTRDLRQLGFAIGVVQDLGTHLLAGVRYDRYDADRDAFEREGVDLVGVHQLFSTVSVMAAGRWHDARLVVQYDHERNPFGRGDDGAPTTRAADRVTLRAQVGF